MPDHYLFDRAGITRDYITACRARELLVEAQASELEADLCGDLGTGFHFWSFDAESGLKLIHYHVIPMPADEVRENARDAEGSSLTLSPPKSTWLLAGRATACGESPSGEVAMIPRLLRGSRFTNT